MERIGIRSPAVLYDTLARHVGAFCCIRKPSICQVKAFDGVCPLEPQNDVAVWGMSDADGSVVLSRSISRYQNSAYRSHESVLQACGKHHVQGVWAQLAHPAGARGAEPARIRD